MGCYDTVEACEQGAEEWYECTLTGLAQSGLTTYETDVANLPYLQYVPYFLRHTVVNDIVTETYIGFIITPAMVTSNPGMVAGTYYLQATNDNSSYSSNLNILQTALGSAYDSFCSPYYSGAGISCDINDMLGFDLNSSSGTITVTGEYGITGCYFNSSFQSYCAY